MTKLTDGSQTIGITMCVRGYAGRRRPDISAGFFETGGLPKAEDGETCIVEDVSCCVDRAFDWSNYRKSFFDPEAEVYNKENGFTRRVTVEAI